MLDAALFDPYNRCDLEKFSSFFVDIDRFAVISINVEFYFDQGGPTFGKGGVDRQRPLAPMTLEGRACL
jgi:hypothetical protein